MAMWCGLEGSTTPMRIFLYDGSSVTRLTDNDYEDHPPLINAKGHVVWKRQR
jgi:hypothetical protein